MNVMNNRMYKYEKVDFGGYEVEWKNQGLQEVISDDGNVFIIGSGRIQGSIELDMYIERHTWKEDWVLQHLTNDENANAKWVVVSVRNTFHSSENKDCIEIELIAKKRK